MIPKTANVERQFFVSEAIFFKNAINFCQKDTQIFKNFAFCATERKSLPTFDIPFSTMDDGVLLC